MQPDEIELTIHIDSHKTTDELMSVLNSISSKKGVVGVEADFVGDASGVSLEYWDERP